MPRRSASKMTKSRSVILIVQFLVQLSVAAFGLLCLTQAIQRNSGAAHGFHRCPASKLWPMAITSPVAFIWVPSCTLGV